MAALQDFLSYHFLSLVLLAALIAFIISQEERKPKENRYFREMIILILIIKLGNTLAWFEATYNTWNCLFCQYLDTYFQYLLIPVALLRAIHVVHKGTPKWYRYVPLAISVILCIINMFDDGFLFFFSSDYHFFYRYRAPRIIIYLVSGFYSLLFCFFALRQARKDRHENYLMVVLIMLSAVVIVWSFYEYLPFPFDVVILLDMLLYYIHLTLVYQRDLVQKEYQTRLQLLDSRVKLMQSQLQPHFIMNSLNSICEVCSDNPEALGLIREFSGYLRGFMSAMNSSECIPAEEELNTVSSYLTLQKRRFREQLKVFFDIQDTDFEIPAFTVQLLVENSIRHGIRAQKNGNGTLIITSYATDTDHVVTVKDDGVGFNLEELSAMGNSHTGIRNIRRRLRLMCNGTISYESAPGHGTTATVRIPLKGEPEKYADADH